MRTFFKINDQKTLAGNFQFALKDGVPKPVVDVVHDGDTINVSPAGHLGIRFLAIDTPEVSFKNPTTNSFIDIDRPEWIEYLSNLPNGFNGSDELKAYLENRLGPNCATNHAEHAEAARIYLVDAINSDMAELGVSEKDFPLFLVFSYEALDLYGRLLAYVHAGGKSPITNNYFVNYNRRLLESGMAEPYFMFPNIDPFRTRDSVFEAVHGLDSPGAILENASKLRHARGSVIAAREAGLGVFSTGNPLQLSPFELRFLARKSAPRSRMLINLGGADDSTLYPGDEYFRFPAEDRLWVPFEFVPLFETEGWASTN